MTFSSSQKMSFVNESVGDDLVGGERLELSYLAVPAPKAGVSTSFTTRPRRQS